MSDPRLLKLTDRMLPFRANVENSPGTKAFGKKLLINSQITWIVMKQKEISLFLDDDDGAQSCLTFTTPWIVTCQAPLPMEFSKQEYWSGLSFPSPERGSSWPRDWTQISCVASRIFTYWATREALTYIGIIYLFIFN